MGTGRDRTTVMTTHDVLFRVAGGPRVGFGHVLRSLSLATALGVHARLSVRGSDATARTARRLGADVDRHLSPTDLDPAQTQVLVVDDPSARAASPWVRVARARGIRAVSVHDLGIAPLASDLAIDGSVAPGAHRTAQRALLGLRYTVLDPALVRLRDARQAASRRGGARTSPPRVIVSLGGGVRAGLALRLARAIRAAAPAADVRVAGGFVTRAQHRADDVRWIEPADFRRELAGATAAVLAGGVSLYEACALGVPAVALSVVPSQIPTVEAFGRRGVAIDAGLAIGRASRDAARVSERVALAMAQLLAAPTDRQRLARRARYEVDGRGAFRVAGAIRALRRDGRRAR
jgi:UDP-2,4-diacetamido-2,4,6-trideoxy-beta-L-altropyranose hydrolase